MKTVLGRWECGHEVAQSIDNPFEAWDFAAEHEGIGGPDGDCPFCEITRLRAQIEQERAVQTRLNDEVERLRLENARLIERMTAINLRLAEMQRRYADTCDLLDREAEHNGR